MNAGRQLTIVSLIAIVLTLFHLADDVVRGFEPGGFKNLNGMLILAVWLYAAIALAGTRTGCALLILGSLLAIAIPVTHLRGAGVGGAIAASSGGYFFIATLFGLGAIGPVALVLSGRGLRRARERPSRSAQ